MVIYGYSREKLYVNLFLGVKVASNTNGKFFFPFLNSVLDLICCLLFIIGYARPSPVFCNEI